MRPDEVKALEEPKPSFIYDAVNALIAGSLRNRSSCTISKKAVLEKIRQLKPSDVAFDWAWLDFEPEYREAGWKVTYDGPGYNEDYEATYTFIKP